MDLLAESREVIRNDVRSSFADLQIYFQINRFFKHWCGYVWNIFILKALLALIELTRGNSNIQKIVAFENGFESIFNIIRDNLIVGLFLDDISKNSEKLKMIVKNWAK